MQEPINLTLEIDVDEIPTVQINSTTGFNERLFCLFTGLPIPEPIEISLSGVPHTIPSGTEINPVCRVKARENGGHIEFRMRWQNIPSSTHVQENNDGTFELTATMYIRQVLKPLRLQC